MTLKRATIVQEAVNLAIRERGEIGLQVAAYLNGKLVVDAWGGLANEITGRKVDADTLFPVFSLSKMIPVIALHIQAERGLVDYYTPIAKYWPEFGAHGKDHGTVYDALTHRLGVPIMPHGVTAELMCDWDWMVQRIADMTPLFEPGTRSAYMAYTFGWVIGEVVRRTDPKRRPFGKFVQEEICQPLGIDNLWVGISDEAEPRVAKVTNTPSSSTAASARHPGVLRDLAHPRHLDTTEEVFGRPDVRRACIPGIGGIMNARSQARLWALLAQGGELDGVRLLSEERIRLFTVPCPPAHYDYVEGEPPNYTIAGFRRATPFTGNNPHIVAHTGAGGSIGWADLDAHLAVAFTHNRMFRAPTLQDHPYMPIVNAIRKTLGLAA